MLTRHKAKGQYCLSGGPGWRYGRLLKRVSSPAPAEKVEDLSSEYFIPEDGEGRSGEAPELSFFRDGSLPVGAAYEAQRARVLKSAATYSRFVRALKLLLPLLAFVVVVSTMLFVLLYQPDDTLTLSFTRAEAVENDLRMVNPRFSGVDGEGRPFLVTASWAIQDITNPRSVSLETLQADMELGGRSWISLSAARGLLDGEAETLYLEGGISVFTDAGYEFHTDHATVRLDQQRVTSDAEVTGQGPLGTLRADSFTADGEGERVRFAGNVRMRIYPPGS